MQVRQPGSGTPIDELHGAVKTDQIGVISVISGMLKLFGMRYDVGPTVIQRCADVSCLLGLYFWT